MLPVLAVLSLFASLASSLSSVTAPTRLVVLATTNIRGSVGKESRLGVCTKELYQMFQLKIASAATSGVSNGASSGVAAFPPVWVNLNDACLGEFVFTAADMERAKKDLVVTLEVRPNFVQSVAVEPSLSVARMPVYATDVHNGGLIEKQLHVFFDVGTGSITSSPLMDSSAVGSLVSAATAWATLMSLIVFRRQIVDGIVIVFGSTSSRNNVIASSTVKR